MSSTSENETEILLGNRHLLAIFFVLAVLLGIAFTGGYMVGRNGSDKRPTAAAVNSDPVASTTTGAATLTVPPAVDGADTQQAGDQSHAAKAAPTPDVDVVTVPVKDNPPLGARKVEPETLTPPPPVAQPPAAKTTVPTSRTEEHFNGPQSGQTFLQVAAVGRTEANALAIVLSKKSFRAHAVAKPGSNDIYRVLIGPMRDASELSATRDSLRNAGFTKIFVQKY